MENTSVAIAISGLSFMMTIIWGEPLIRILKAWRIGKVISQDGPDQHTAKTGTPTMGGLMILIPVTLLTILFNAVSIFGFNLLGRSILLPLVTLWAFALLGMIDDWEGIRGPRRGLGMRARVKFGIQVILAIAIAFALRDILEVPQLIWFTSEEVLSLGSLYIPVAVFIIQCHQFYGWAGRAGRADLSNCICRIWLCGCISRTGFSGPILLFVGWRFVWFLVVQCTPSNAFHGRHRITGLRRDPGCGCPHDWPMADHPPHCCNPG